MQKIKKTLTISLIVLILLLGATGGAFAYYFDILTDKMNRPTAEDVETGEVDPGYFIPDDAAPEDLGIVVEPKKSTSDDIFNMLLFGIDTAAGEQSRSDVIAYCSINKTKGTVSIVSVLRDTLLDMPVIMENQRASGPDKAAHAFSYGGPQLALATLNSNFHTDITDYAVVNFNQMEDIIDAVNGLDIDVTRAEMAYVNRGVREVNRDNGRSRNEGALEEYGENIHLTGRQAVAFARIRKLDGDRQRSQRQRTVLEALINKIFSEIKQNPLSVITMVDAVLPMVTTNLSNEDIIGIAQALITAGKAEFKQDRIPADGDYTTGYRGTSWVITPDMDKARERLHAYLYQEESSQENLQATGTPPPSEDLDGEDARDVDAVIAEDEAMFNEGGEGDAE